jgi:sigma-E factor negative regulatory protein RseC
MSTNQKEIKHQGIIRQITDDFYFVSVERTAACHGCAAKGFCNISTNKSETIPVQRLPHQNFCIGDEVTLSLAEKMGWKALFYGYGLPFLALIAGIIIAAAINLPQGAIGLIGLGLLTLYYVVFSFFRKKIDRQFSFKI